LRYIWQHINTIIDSYNGSIPLTHFLKNYFKLHPKLGSRDRKILSEMAYCWYRCSKGLSLSLSFEERMSLCLKLCNASSKHIQQFLPEEFSEPTVFHIEQIFDHAYELSEGIKREEWLDSMLQQPRLFIRIRKNRDKTLQTLTQHEIAFETVSDTCLSLPNGAAIDKKLAPDTYVVQDASSQQTGSYFQPKPGQTWYDSCSGAGGKSLLLKDLEPSVKLTVSDKRDTILRNLNSRFKQYGHNLPTSHIIDVANKKQLADTLNRQRFDNIICDVPCSGSGTWARTPEQLYFFDPAILEDLQGIQRSVAVNASAYLKPGGKLFYITCSVFSAENEKVVDGILSETGLQIETRQLINGIKKHADCMFITVFTKK
jgi:16S rRNA (cytosine967-C5)-methyltransferase